MENIEMTFSKNTLYIDILGVINKKIVKKIKQKLYCIVDEYEIEKVIVNVKNSNILDPENFYDFLDEYDIKYNSKLVLIE